MKGSSAIVWIAALVVIAFGLFHIKHAVQGLEEDYAAVNREILESRQAIHVLRAEWSYLSRPERLAGLAERHLGLVPMTPTQVVGFEAAARDAATPASLAAAGGGVQ